MNWVKILGWSIIVVLFLAIAPLPLAYLVDFTFHWLLLVTIPVGVTIISILAIIRQYLVEKTQEIEIVILFQTVW